VLSVQGCAAAFYEKVAREEKRGGAKGVDDANGGAQKAPETSWRRRNGGKKKPLSCRKVADPGQENGGTRIEA